MSSLPPPRHPQIAAPLLMECDRQGHVHWLSGEARLALGDVTSLMDVACAPVPSVRFSRVFESHGRVLISAQFPEAAEASARADAAEWLHLHARLMRHCFRLVNLERSLAGRARQARTGERRPVLLQLEQERQRLGRELHTGVGQLLAAIRLQLEIIEAKFPDPPAPVQQALTSISTLARDALQQVRSVSRRLHPPEWQRLNLDAALRQLWDLSGIAQHYQSSLSLESLPEEPELEIKTLIYRAAQEALSNLTRHSQATQVEMRLAVRGSSLFLTIQDNGVGFNPARLFAAPASVASGLGLRSIREQAASLGGKLIVSSGPGGTQLEISAPLPGSSS